MFYFFACSLLYLLALQCAGLLFTKYLLRASNHYFTNFIFGYFIVASLSAVCFTEGNTIAWGVIIILLYFLWKRKDVDIPIPEVKNHLEELTVMSVLFTACFLSRYSVHFNQETGLSNIPYRDYVFYINHCEYLYLDGTENKLTSKNILFPEISFNEIYRFQDSWPMCLLLKTFKNKTIDLYYLVLYPVNFFLVTYSVYFLLKQTLNRFQTKLAVTGSFLFLFYQASDTWFYKTGAMMMGVAGYTKLWLHYTILAFVIFCFNKKKNHVGLLFLLLLFFTVPVTLSVPFFVMSYLIIEVIRSKKLTSFIFLCFTLLMGFMLYYYINKGIEYKQLNSTIPHLGTSFNPDSLWLALTYKALFIVYITPVILLLVLFRLSKQNTPFDKKVFYYTGSILICGYILYVLLNQTNDSLQLYSNIAAPLCALISFILIFSLSQSISNKYLSVIMKSGFFFILLTECYLVHTTNAHYRREDITGQFSRTFVDSCTKQFEEKITNPIGIYFDSDKYGSVSEQHVRDTRFNITLLLCRYADVVNIKADSIIFDQERYKKIDVDLNRMAVNYFKQHHSSESNVELEFIRSKNIQYLLSIKKQQFLPTWLQGIICDSIQDSKSGLNVYFLD